MLKLQPRPHPAMLLRRPRRTLPFPLDVSERSVVAPGRALPHALAAAGLTAGDEVIAPLDCRPAVIDARLAAGVVPRLHPVGGALEPDEAELTALAGTRTRALVLVHRLGWPARTGSWRRWCDARGLLLIEDCWE